MSNSKASMGKKGASGGQKEPTLERALPGRLGRSDYLWLTKGLVKVEGPDESVDVGTDSLFARAIRQYGFSWWRYYELSTAHHIASLCRLMGWEDALIDAGKQKNPTKAFLDFAKIDIERDDVLATDTDITTVSLVINLLFGLMFTLESISVFGLSINELLEKARHGDKKSFRDAFSIDKTVVATATGAAIISRAQLADEKTLAFLFKRMKPHDRRRLHPELRLMRRIFAEVGALDNGVADSIITLLTQDLKLYPEGGGDAAKNIRQLFDSYGE